MPVSDGNKEDDDVAVHTSISLAINIITGRSMVISSMPRYPLPIITSVSPIYVYPF